MSVHAGASTDMFTSSKMGQVAGRDQLKPQSKSSDEPLLTLSEETEINVRLRQCCGH